MKISNIARLLRCLQLFLQIADSSKYSADTSTKQSALATFHQEKSRGKKRLGAFFLHSKLQTPQPSNRVTDF